MGSIISKHDEEVSSPVVEYGMPTQNQNKRRTMDGYLKMRLYNTIVPEIQKKLGDKEAQFVMKYNSKIESEFFWSSMMSCVFTVMATLPLMRRQRISWYKKGNKTFPATKFIKYFPLTFLLVSGFNIVLFQVFQRTSGTPPAINSFLDRNQQTIDQLLKDRYQPMTKHFINQNIANTQNQNPNTYERNGTK